MCLIFVQPLEVARLKGKMGSNLPALRCEASFATSFKKRTGSERRSIKKIINTKKKEVEWLQNQR